MATPELNSNASTAFSPLPNSCSFSRSTLYLPGTDALELVDAYKLRLTDALTKECTRFAGTVTSNFASRENRITELTNDCATKDKRNEELEGRIAVLWKTVTRTVKEKAIAEQRYTELAKANDVGPFKVALLEAEKVRDAMKTKVQETNAQLVRMQGDNDSLRRERDDLASKNANLENKHDAERAERVKLTAEVKSAAARADSLKAQLDATAAESSKTEARANAFVGSIQIKDAAIAWWRTEHEKLRVANQAANTYANEVEHRLKGQDEKLAQVTARLDEEKTLRRAAEDNFADKTRELATVRNEKALLKDMLSESERRRVDALQRLGHVETELDEVKTMSHTLSVAVGLVSSLDLAL